MTSDDSAPSLTCFVSGASGTDISIVKVVLQAAGITVRTSDDIPLGQDVSAAISSAILAADFLCVVAGGRSLSPTVAFEAGVAAGSQRPILVIIDGKPDLIERGPLASMPRIVFDSSTDDGIRNLTRTIEAYVQNVQPIAARLQIDWDEWSNPSVGLKRTLNSTIRASGLERHVAERLVRAGALVTTEDRDIDAIATFPALGQMNRVAVEVKSRTRPVRGQLRASDIEQLRSKMMASNISLGLLVYGGSDVEATVDFDSNSLFGELFGGILVVSAKDLLSWTESELVKRLIQLRNTVLHNQR